jgi:RNA polymerase sigma factor (sigma-70 family)
LTAPKLVENFFRHEYSRLVAVIARRSGMHHVALIEDAVQSALMKALETWKLTGTPDNPSGWLYRVAQNAFVSELRKRAGGQRLAEQIAIAEVETADRPETFLGEMQDDLLRMLFVCCDEAIPVESQMVLALKTLCGFGIGEISPRLLLSEANVYKRLARARNRLRQLDVHVGDLTDDQMASRVPAVNKVLYALFAEGHLSSQAEFSMRRDLCDEAIRLATLLAEHRVGKSPEVFALLALMHLHVARMSAREDGRGGLLLLEEQDRALWDNRRIELGLQWLARSAQGERLSRYHAEAGIAAEHCLAPSLQETRWDRIVECYSQLEMIAPNPLNRLNRAVAMAEWLGPAAALAELEAVQPPSWLDRSYLQAAVLADLNRRCGKLEQARRHADDALDLAPSPVLKALLRKRLLGVWKTGEQSF